MRSLAAVILLILVTTASADEHTRSVLLLDQSTVNAPWSVALQASLLSKLSTDPARSISIYKENLDFGLFGTPEYDQQLGQFLGMKYKAAPPDVIVVIGAKALAFLARSRAELFPNVPVVFSAVDEAAAAKVAGLPNITGTIMRFPFSDLVAAARIVKPDFTNLVIVGDPFSRQPYRGHFPQEIEAMRGEVSVTDLTGLPMSELRTRVSNLDDSEVVAYTNIYGDGQGLVYTPAEAIAVIAGIANRPIVVDVETFVGSGSVGGFVVRPEPIGEAAADLVLRLLDGEAASGIPVTIGDFKTPVFDWRQLQRWRVDETRLPSESDVRFRVPTAWERYKLPIMAVSILILLQSLLIAGLIYERRGRLRAELTARHRMVELARANKVAAAGVLSASMAHEISQPLTAIVTNGDAGLMWLEKKQPRIQEATKALTEIVREGHRISDIINMVRALFRREEEHASELNLAEMTGEALALYETQTRSMQIVVANEIANDLPGARGDRVQVLQVLSNVILNGIEAIADASIRRLYLYGEYDEATVRIHIADTGPGIGKEDQAKIFDAFFTTKKQGMGLGLVISKSIAVAQGGELSVQSDKNGTTFTLVLQRWDVTG